MIRRNSVISVFCTLAAIGLAGAGCGKSEPEAKAPSFQAKAPQAVPGSGKTLGQVPPTSDAREVARRVVSAFKAVDGLQIATSSDQYVQEIQGVGSHQESVITYRKSPARLSRVVVDQVGGTYRSVADGANLITYSGMTNTFTRQECRGDLAEISRMVHAETPQILSAASYLMSGSTPHGMEDFKLSGRKSVNGKQAYVLNASCSRDFMIMLARQLRLAPELNTRHGRVEILVDAETYFPLKQRIELSWNGKPKGARKAKNLTIVLNERVTRVTPNPQVREEDFKFAAPANAKEVFTSRKETASIRP